MTLHPRKSLPVPQWQESAAPPSAFATIPRVVKLALPRSSTLAGAETPSPGWGCSHPEPGPELSLDSAMVAGDGTTSPLPPPAARNPLLAPPGLGSVSPTGPVRTSLGQGKGQTPCWLWPPPAPFSVARLPTPEQLCPQHPSASPSPIARTGQLGIQHGL